MTCRSHWMMGRSCSSGGVIGVNRRSVEHTQVGFSPDAHWVATSLWLQRLSMTDGYFVKTMPVDGVWRVVLYALVVETWVVRSRRR